MKFELFDITSPEVGAMNAPITAISVVRLLGIVLIAKHLDRIQRARIEGHRQVVKHMTACLRRTVVVTWFNENVGYDPGSLRSP